MGAIIPLSRYSMTSLRTYGPRPDGHCVTPSSTTPGDMGWRRAQRIWGYGVGATDDLMSKRPHHLMGRVLCPHNTLCCSVWSRTENLRFFNSKYTICQRLLQGLTSLRACPFHGSKNGHIMVVILREAPLFLQSVDSGIEMNTQQIGKACYLPMRNFKLVDNQLFIATVVQIRFKFNKSFQNFS